MRTGGHQHLRFDRGKLADAVCQFDRCIASRDNRHVAFDFALGARSPITAVVRCSPEPKGLAAG